MLADKPPNYEAPLEYFRTPITPNDQFFVRYHLADIPEVERQDLQDFRRRRRRQRPGRDHARRFEGDAGDRSGCGQPVLGQPARPVEAACAGRRMGLRRHGLREMEGRQAQGRARQGRREDRGDRDRLQRRRRTGDRQDAGLHQEHSDMEGDRCRHHHRLRDERGAAAALQRRPGPPHRAGLDRHLLDEASRQHPGADQAARRLLDEAGLSHPGRRIPGGCALHVTQEDGPTRRSPRSWSIR